MTTADKPLREIFQAVFWPAAAGNVFWSFCSLAIDRSSDLASPEVVARLAVLLLLSLYLSIEWLRNYRTFPADVPWRFWFFDWLHVCFVVLVALTAYFRAEWLPAAMIGYFGITALGHFLGGWDAADADAMTRNTLSLINVVGVAVVVVGLMFGSVKPWHLPASFLVVLVLWGGFRWHEIRRLFSEH